ncbi:hypothetical protein PLEOSDRAFT_1048021 [Pleurotus ostreatus PC15]|uniref:Major facilitator superfamily (MFS) profile domain-containing protein n=1 Tax=Pleurotus ostreatus (strain PC15) TaxID=1137138 RepID=A0A067NIT6_PLEO1|nr:hypothetical protein PLEOSDRAFT_1048021 [Pleurotus ostreatus PC15]
MATVTFGYVNAFGVYQDIYTRSQAATASNVSWIGSTQLFFLFAMGLPAGKLLDMGYLRQTNLVGSLICLFVSQCLLFMVSLAHTDTYYQVYLSQGVGLGVGAGLLYVPAVAVQAHHWKRRRAFAMGVVVTGSSLGGIIFPIMLNRLFQSSVGFEWGVRASAFVVLGLLIMANLLMSDNPSVKGGGEKPVLKNILTDIPFMLSSFGVFVITWGIFFPYFYVQLFAVLHGVDPSIAFYSLAIMNAAGLPGRVLPGILADRFGPFNIIVPVLLVNAALIFALFGVSAEGGIVAFVVFYGAIRFGVGYFMSAFGTLIGAPIDGALLGKSFLWSKPIIFSGASIFQNYEGFR